MLVNSSQYMLLLVDCLGFRLVRAPSSTLASRWAFRFQVCSTAHLRGHLESYFEQTMKLKALMSEVLEAIQDDVEIKLREKLSKRSIGSGAERARVRRISKLHLEKLLNRHKTSDACSSRCVEQ